MIVNFTYLYLMFDCEDLFVDFGCIMFMYQDVM